MGLHLENEVTVVKTQTIISHNPVYISFLVMMRLNVSRFLLSFEVSRSHTPTLAGLL